MNRAPQILLLDCPDADRRLAFGLRWLALIGSDVPSLARARGRRLRATHLVVGGAAATMAGYGRVRGAWTKGLRRRQARQIQSAAQLYALMYPGGGQSLIPLPDGRYWLVAAQDGMVLSQADRLFATRDEAMRAQARLLDQRPDMLEHDADAVWAALLREVNPAALLMLLPSRWKAMPPALRLFAVCVAFSAAAPPLWNVLTQRLGTSKSEALPQAALPADPHAAHRAMLAEIGAHAGNEVLNLLRSVGKLPVQVQGWALRRAQCDADPKGWECAATYARAHALATNLRLHEQLPAGWRLSFKPLDAATLHWRVASTRVSLANVALPNALRVDTELAAALQRLQPAFASVTLAPAVVVPLPGPIGAEPAPASVSTLPAIRRRALRLHGPLRSLALLPGPLAAVRWSHLGVDVQAAHRSTLASSTLVAELHGELYEQE